MLCASSYIAHLGTSIAGCRESRSKRRHVPVVLQETNSIHIRIKNYRLYDGLYEWRGGILVASPINLCIYVPILGICTNYSMKYKWRD